MIDFGSMNFAIAQHHQDVECAIRYLVDLYLDDVDITDQEVFRAVMKKYSLDEDGFEDEYDNIKTRVYTRLHLIAP